MDDTDFVSNIVILQIEGELKEIEINQMFKTLSEFITAFHSKGYDIADFDLKYEDENDEWQPLHNQEHYSKAVDCSNSQSLYIKAVQRKKQAPVEPPNPMDSVKLRNWVCQMCSRRNQGKVSTCPTCGEEKPQS